MLLPRWLMLLVAAVVALFGAYRLRLFFRGAEKYAELGRRSPMYRVPRRMHLMMGSMFLALGVWMFVTALGLL